MLLGVPERPQRRRDHRGQQVADRDDPALEEMLVQPDQVPDLLLVVGSRDRRRDGVGRVGLDQQAVEPPVAVPAVPGAGRVRGVVGDPGQFQRPVVAGRGVPVAALHEDRLGAADLVEIVGGRSAALRVLRFVVPETLDPRVGSAAQRSGGTRSFSSSPASEFTSGGRHITASTSVAMNAGWVCTSRNPGTTVRPPRSIGRLAG